MKFPVPLYEGEGAVGGGNPPPTPPAAPWASATAEPWKIGEGAAARPWFDAIPEEPVRELVKAKGYKTPAELAVAYHNANKLVSGPNNVQVPAADAPDNVWNEYFAKTRGGVADPTKYDLKVKDGVTVDPTTLEFGKKLAFDLGLHPKQAQAMVDRWNDFVGQTTTQQAAAEAQKNDTAIAALKEKYGPNYDANIAAGKRAMSALGYKPEELGEIEKHMGAAPLVDLFVRLGAKAGEPNFLSGGGGAQGSDIANMTPEQAKTEITKLREDASFQEKYTNAQHAEHKASVDRMNALYARSAAKA